MTNKNRKIIGWVALVVLAAALALIIFYILPNETQQEIIPVTPTYLIPPAVIP